MPLVHHFVAQGMSQWHVPVVQGGVKSGVSAERVGGGVGGEGLESFLLSDASIQHKHSG